MARLTKLLNETLDKSKKAAKLKLMKEAAFNYARMLLPLMVDKSNRSRLTMDVAKSLEKKLDDREMKDFIDWLHLTGK